MEALGRILSREIAQRAAAVEQALEDLSEAAVWKRPAPATNAAGNLALHVAGNLMKYVARGVGGRPFDRDRPAEFFATGLPRAEVLARFREAVRNAIEVLDAVSDADLDLPYEGPEFAGRPRRAVAIHSVEHLGYHTGQIVLTAKLLAGR